MQKVRFVWQGVTERFGHWNDGLREAMRILEKEFEVTYHEPDEDIEDGIILYWEAPCTMTGKYAANYAKVHNSPLKKVLLFAGGPIQYGWVHKFDHICVESEINEREFAQIGMPYTRAFGINDKVFKPKKVTKEYDGVHHGTFASWKRQDLMCKALGKSALAIGRYQSHDTKTHTGCLDCNSVVIDEVPYSELPGLLSSAHVCVQTSDYWGGGQRCTLEAMACGLPVVVMKDSPKNCEYILESGAGLIVDPEPEKIKAAVEEIKGWSKEEKERGIAYLKSKWTAKHYADALRQVILSL